MNRLQADEHTLESSVSENVLLRLSVSKNGLESSIIFQPHEILSHAQSVDKQLAVDDFICKQNYVTPHTH